MHIAHGPHGVPVKLKPLPYYIVVVADVIGARVLCLLRLWGVA